MLIDEELKFEKMATRFGEVLAYQCLVEIEKAACIPSWTVYGIDPETRLANAIRIQDASNDNQSYWLA